MKKRTLVIIPLILATMSNQAISTPIKFTYSTTVNVSSSGENLGVFDGDVLNLEIIADNGRADIDSGFWDMEDILSAKVKVGSYIADFNYPYWKASFYAHSIWTDSTGSVSSVSWGDHDNNNTDNLGGSWSPQVYNNSIFTSDRTRFDFQGYYINDARAWTVSEVDVPEPASFVLLGLGMLGLRLSRRYVS